MDIILNGFDWKIKGFWPYVPMLKNSMEIGNDLMGVTEWIKAEVPGGVHCDLLKAGLIEDPYFEQNSLKCEWVENRWWKYKTEFTPDAVLKDKKLTFIFKGIDYKAHFYLNDQKLGVHEGMYTPASFDITGKLDFNGTNTLEVLLENAPEEMAQIGHTSMTTTQKSRFNYKWDFSTHIVNIGIWDDVLLKATGDALLKDTFISGDVVEGCGVIKINVDTAVKSGNAFTVHASVSSESGIIWAEEEEIIPHSDTYRYCKQVQVKDPKLWYPNGIGEQNLYKVIVKVSDKRGLFDQKEFSVGIRRLEYSQNIGSSKNSFPYTFIINGIPVYIKGINLVPFDHFYGNVTRETYDQYIRMIKDANINMVRIWGGGIIEKEYFYDLCDRNGILVWQEFIQSSSGIDNIPSEDAHFLELLKAGAEQAVRLKRNHVCHTVWSGGNELTDKNGVPVTYSNSNIKMLKEIVERYDPEKLFLPSSASGPNEFLDIEKPGTNHDVHGNWKYEGIVAHYTKYNRSDSLFHSEVGVDGCSNIFSLKKFLSPENLYVTDMKENLVWRHHGEWWDTLERDEEIFGKINSLEQFTAASQFIQAEGLRYIVEANRRRKFNNSGTVLWQFNEPWPNVSCTALVDYYGNPKMAYYWVKKAYSPVHISMKYDKLFYKPGEEFKSEIFVHNCLEEREMTISCEILDVNGGFVLKEQYKKEINSNNVIRICGINTVVPLLPNGVFFVRLSADDASGRVHSDNMYIFSQSEKEIFSSLLKLNSGKLQVECVDEGFKVKNIGDAVCLFVRGIAEGKECTLFDENYISVFPGEEYIYQVRSAATGRSIYSKDLDISWGFLNSIPEMEE